MCKHTWPIKLILILILIIWEIGPAAPPAVETQRYWWEGHETSLSARASQSLSVSDSSWFLDSYSWCTRGDMSGRVGDLSVKQAEALAQVNYYSFIPVKSMSWIYLLRVLDWNILPIREATLSADENSRITLVLNAESIDFYKSTKVLVNRSFAELCKLCNCWSLQCCQHVNRCC